MMELSEAKTKTRIILKRAIEYIQLLSDEDAQALGEEIIKIFNKPKRCNSTVWDSVYYPPHNIVMPQPFGPKQTRRLCLAEILSDEALASFIKLRIRTNAWKPAYVFIALEEMKLINRNDRSRSKVAEALGEVNVNNFNKIINRYKPLRCRIELKAIHRSVERIKSEIISFKSKEGNL